jgi:hypothetical protein
MIFLEERSRKLTQIIKEEKKLRARKRLIVATTEGEKNYTSEDIERLQRELLETEK